MDSKSTITLDFLVDLRYGTNFEKGLIDDSPGGGPTYDK